MPDVTSLPLPEQIVYAGRLMFERRLSDLSGGNISARQGDYIYITPRYAGSRQGWQLDPSDILVGPLQGDELLNHPRISREAKVHLAIYRAYPEVGAVIHAHPFHVLAFAAAGRPIVPVLESAQKFGVIPVTPFAPAHSQEIAGHVVAALAGKEANIHKQAAAAIVPTHGIVVAGKDLLAALDALERIDWNAWCILAGRLLPNS
jgi:L-fuculose-phosphate aldolase